MQIMTAKNYVFRVFAYKDVDGTFTAVCLDLDIIEERFATLQQAVLSINEAIDSHVKAVTKSGFSKELLNRPAPKEYWDKLKEFTHPTPYSTTPFQYFTATSEGHHQLYA